MFLLRAATSADAPAVLALWREAEAEPTHTDNLESVSQLLRRDPASLIVAEENGRIIGSVIAGWDGWRYHLYRLAVHPDYRRQGVATLLLERGQQRLVGLGALRIDAMVRDDNQLGQSVWVARGYHRQAEWSRWVKESLRSSG